MGECNSCQSQIELLIDLGSQPIVNKLLNQVDEDARLFPMKVGGCTQCGLVQLMEPIDRLEFYTDYATPSSWKREPHVERLLAYLEQVVPRDARILEVGCNDGRFLQHLKVQGWVKLSGLEPTGNTSDEAARKGFTIYNQSLDSKAASTLVEEHGCWDCVVLRQVLEHISDLNDFGLALHNLLREDGLLVIEVPDSRLNIRSLDYALWEEHVNCFTPESLGRFLAQHGFQTIHSYTSVFSGVCLTVIAQKVAHSSDPGLLITDKHNESLQVEINEYREWSKKFPAFKEAVRNEVQHFAEHGDVVLYGVGSRSSTFVNFLGLGSLVAYAVDDQPEKQNKFMPHSGIKIHSSDEMLSRTLPPQLVLLGVNAENEEAILKRSNFLRNIPHNSVLPPSSRLLRAWKENPTN